MSIYSISALENELTDADSWRDASAYIYENQGKVKFTQK